MFKGKMGVEIECLTQYYRELQVFCDTQNWGFGGDSSISGCNTGEQTCEFKPGVYKISEKPKMVKLLKTAFPLFRVNDTCGLHIHLSFEKMSDYYKLANFKFVEYFQNIIKQKFRSKKEKDRLTGTSSRWCKFYNNSDEFNKNTDIQLRSHNKNNRYFAINYNSYNLYKTIEFRIFASTDSIKKFNEYLNLLLNSVDNYLKQNLFETKKFKVKVRKKPINSGPVIIQEIITKEELNQGVQNE